MLRRRMLRFRVPSSHWLRVRSLGLGVLLAVQAGCSGTAERSFAPADAATTFDGGATSIDGGQIDTEPDGGIIPFELSFGVMSAAGGSDLPFTIGQALREGDLPQSTSFKGRGTDIQTIVKNRWPDGSAKFVLLSGRSSLAANVWSSISIDKVKAQAPAANEVVTALAVAQSGLSVRIEFEPHGSAMFGADEWLTPVDTHATGTIMSSFTYRKPIGADAHLVAWIELRAYSKGEVELLAWIENGFLQVANPDGKTGHVRLHMNDAVRFESDLSLKNHQRTVLAEGEEFTHWAQRSSPRLVWKHDLAYLMETKLVPNYRSITAPTSPIFERLTQMYVPLAQADFQSDMGATGYHPGIGLLPEWDVAYLTTRGDARALRAVLVNGCAAGRYGTHFRDELTMRPLRFSDHPNLVMNDGSGVSFIGASSTLDYTPAIAGGSPPTYDSPHHPSMGFMAYLLSGFHYFIEETQLLATANFLKSSDQTRQFSKGVFESSAGANITRGAAWSIRTLAQALALTPDDDTLRAELSNSLQSNVVYYHHRYVETPNNPLGLVQPYDHYDGTEHWTAAPWMDDFFTATMGYVKDLKLVDAATATKLDSFLAWKYRSVVGRLGGSGSDQYSFRFAAQYTVPYAPTNDANWDDGSGPWYASWGEVARVMNLDPVGNDGDTLQGGYPETATAYWGNLMPALSYAVDHGADGATRAYQRLSTAGNIGPQVLDYNDNPVWGVVPRSLAKLSP